MTKFTPGPWEYGVATNYEGFYIAPLGTLPTLAGCERFGKKMTVSCFNFLGETEANARLIATAPELLQAAQKALDECVDLIATEAGNALEAAIAKATGK